MSRLCLSFPRYGFFYQTGIWKTLAFQCGWIYRRDREFSWVTLGRPLRLGFSGTLMLLICTPGETPCNDIINACRRTSSIETSMCFLGCFVSPIRGKLILFLPSRKFFLCLLSGQCFESFIIFSFYLIVPYYRGSQSGLLPHRFSFWELGLSTSDTKVFWAPLPI